VKAPDAFIAPVDAGVSIFTNIDTNIDTNVVIDVSGYITPQPLHCLTRQPTARKLLDSSTTGTLTT